MTDLERALLHIKTRADAWAVKEVEKALEQKPCDKCVYSTKDGYCQYDDITEAIPPLEPCEDAISRDAVKEIICAEFVDTQDGMSEWRNAVNDVVEEILHKVEQLPSVTQKSGKWERHYIRPNVYKDLLWYCSSCGKGCGYNNAFMFDFCPNCGAKMVEPQESEE